MEWSLHDGALPCFLFGFVILLISYSYSDPTTSGCTITINPNIKHSTFTYIGDVLAGLPGR